jgi:hypothetical protein
MFVLAGLETLLNLRQTRIFCQVIVEIFFLTVQILLCLRNQLERPTVLVQDFIQVLADFSVSLVDGRTN